MLVYGEESDYGNEHEAEEINNLDTETPNGSRGAFIGQQEGTSSYHVPLTEALWSISNLIR